MRIFPRTITHIIKKILAILFFITRTTEETNTLLFFLTIGGAWNVSYLIDRSSPLQKNLRFNSYLWHLGDYLPYDFLLIIHVGVVILVSFCRCLWECFRFLNCWLYKPHTWYYFFFIFSSLRVLWIFHYQYNREKEKGDNFHPSYILLLLILGAKERT